MVGDMHKAAREVLGTLTESEFNRCDSDGWTRTSRDAGSSGRRDAFIGNGLIGMRIPVEGQPSVYPTFAGVKVAPGGTQMYGVWDVDSLLPVFNFMGLELRHGRSVFRRDSGALLNYRQTLDWRTATVETVCDWVHWNGVLHIEFRIYLARHRKNLGCVELAITPTTNARYTVIDRVDGTFMPMVEPMAYFLRRPGDEVKVAYVRAGARRRLLAAATMLSLDGQPVSGDVVLTSGGFERRVDIVGESGRTYFFRKFGALFADGQAEDPIHAAATLVAGSMAHPDQVRSMHEAAWAKLWEHDIEAGHAGVQMLVRNALYQLYANLGEGVGNPPGPTGLTGNAWGGHLFYDGELWTYPAILLLQPELARNYVDYRFRTLPGARRNAAAHGMAGAQFAWEGAEFGDETIPGLVYSVQHHINSDVALTQWQYFLVTGDQDFLEKQGAPIIVENADFWVSRSVYNTMFDRYEIQQVCCADEFAEVQDNNALTNYGAKATLELAVRVQTLLKRPVDPRWREVAAKLWIPFNVAEQRIIEYEGYNGAVIKQADATLIIYPWEMPLDSAAKRNTVGYYRTRYEAEKIMMGSAIDGVIDCELNDAESSWRMFLDLLGHIRGDFLMVSESPFNETISLLTGLGGMLQLVMMGWGGLRIHQDDLAAANHLPAAVPWMKFKGVWHDGRSFDLHYEAGTVRRIDR